MMSYKEALAKMIKKSGLSLRAVAERCSAMQVSVSASYLSQLQTGKLAPPSEEVNRAIAKVCGGNANDLILLGFLDRAPEIVKEYFLVMSNLNKDMLKALSERSIFTSKEYDIEQIDEIQRLFNSVSVFEQFKRAAKYTTDLDYQGLLHSKTLLKYEKDSEVEYSFMKDDSMEPLIPENAMLKFEPYLEFDEEKKRTKRMSPKNRDIVRTTYMDKGEKYTVVRRYQKNDNVVLLIPENTEYDVIIIQEDLDTVLFEKLVLYQKAI